MTTVAPGITAPDGSVTVPLSVAASSCALAVLKTNAAASSIGRNTSLLRMKDLPGNFASILGQAFREGFAFCHARAFADRDQMIGGNIRHPLRRAVRPSNLQVGFFRGA